eukprot:SAG31_NODE_17238_length_678_cov_0.977547_1_plen_70_part_01
MSRKVTSSTQLGVQGGCDITAAGRRFCEHKFRNRAGFRRSNGGLLVGNMLTRRPDLFGAVLCQVPLLDMQ